jgi:predicted acyl esterase
MTKSSLFLLLTLPAWAQTQPYVVEKNVMAPMRDGVRLATDVYLPARDGTRLEGKFPVVLEPYNKEAAARASAPTTPGGSAPGLTSSTISSATKTFPCT